VPSESRTRTVAFDVIGTLVTLENARSELQRQDAGAHVLELWFAESLRDYFSISHSESYSPLGEVLRAGLTRHGIGDPDAVITAFKKLDPKPGAGDACRMLVESDSKIVALTNGSEELTESLLSHGGLAGYFDDVLSCDSIRVSKPHPRVYEMAKRIAEGDLWMVAAHAWEIAGAARAGLRTVLAYERPDRVPEVFPAPEIIAPDLVGAAHAILTAGPRREP
jgi:2-haloacid dehalogenase